LQRDRCRRILKSSGRNARHTIAAAQAQLIVTAHSDRDQAAF